jgi:putative NADH-flavin reductase
MLIFLTSRLTMAHFKRIALYGYRGWASSAIANSLIAAGGPVSVLHRATSDTSALPAGTPTCEIDLKNRKSIQDALKDIDILM